MNIWYHWVEIEAYERLFIGIFFICIAVELWTVVLIYKKMILPPFVSLIFMFIIFIEVCGISRLSSTAELLHLICDPTSPYSYYETAEAIIDGCSVVTGGSTAVVIFILIRRAVVWNNHLHKNME
jgi:hypothetical protein